MQINAFNKANNKFLECWNNRWSSSPIASLILQMAPFVMIQLPFRWTKLLLAFEANRIFFIAFTQTVCSVVSNLPEISVDLRKKSVNKGFPTKRRAPKASVKGVQLLEVIQSKYWQRVYELVEASPETKACVFMIFTTSNRSLCLSRCVFYDESSCLFFNFFQ